MYQNGNTCNRKGTLAGWPGCPVLWLQARDGGLRRESGRPVTLTDRASLLTACLHNRKGGKLHTERYPEGSAGWH